MRKTLLSLAFLATISNTVDAQYFTENFDGNGPGIGAWTTLDLDGLIVAPNVNFITNGWNVIDLDGENGRFGGPAGDHAAASTSWYSPAGSSNDWLITPLINLTGSTSPILKYSAKSQDPEYLDGYVLKVAPNGGNTVSDFTDTLFTTNGETASEGKPWTERVFSLVQYAGQSIRIAWVNNSNDKFMLLVDDISVEEYVAPSVLTLPFHESFDSNSNSRNNWTNINVDGNASWSFAIGSTSTITTPKAGDANARFVSVNGENTPITKFVSPVISAGTSTNAFLEFYHGNPTWAGDTNALKVYYRLSDTEEWVELFSKDTPTEEWTKEQIQLPAVSTTMQFAFEGINNWGRANVIDEVKVNAGLIPMTVTLPFNETFEDDSSTRAGWTQQSVDGNAEWTYATGASGGTVTTAHNGTKNARFVSVNGDNTPVTKLVTPIVNVGNANKAYLEFHYAQQAWGSDINALKVFYRTSPTSDWVEIYQKETATSTWTKKQIQLPEVSNELQIAFEGINNWGRTNVIDDVQIIAGETPLIVGECGFNSPSNALENGVGNTKTFAYANDFTVNAATKLDVSQVSFNLVSQTSSIESARVTLLTDNNGKPGDVIYTFTGAPSATQSNGTNFNFDFSTYTLNLPETLSLTNDTNRHQVYWMQVDEVVTANANAYFEVTSLTNTPNPLYVFDTNTDAWRELEYDGVFSVIGECEELEVDVPCEFETPSNEIENGHGSISGAEIAHDFQVEDGTMFNLQSVAVNILSSTGVNSATVKVYADDNGVPGSILATVSGAPTTRQSIGSSFGFDSSTYTFNLPSTVSLEGGNTYWVGVTQAVYASGTNGYWESTSVLNSNNTGKFKGTSGVWDDFSEGEWDGVFKIIGECGSLSINDEVIDVTKLSFYPNPVTDVLYVKHKLAVEGVDVFNLAGQKVMATKVKADGSVNLSSLPKGVYIVNATLADGTNQTFKVIKK
ncbi:T9SS-dependent choice-of-anchor J family protein [Faecalibacter macacae]|uniref:T9SS C-terminal target domain-containing protein n=1 Tax=Faecalibacter macacae TaxID=1859289 RepID=A0A3L9MHF9_9FLAO|nr:choice-of-anchor J domain-containing protein [Faecalibacter macacae]RLZ10764.1 T9SS C-terminal target domain-containing protein [Faecalibacter macacae]